MERDFEREFRELKQNEIPDLWNRIEAGLSEKTNVTQVSQKMIAIDHATDTGKPFAWRKWGTLIAACVCVAIILPAFSMFINQKSYSGSGSDMTANTTEAIAEDNAAMDTAAESAESEFGMDAAAAAGGVDEAASASEAAAADTAEAPEEKAPEASSAATVENAQIQETDGGETSRKEEEKAVWNELADGKILEEVVVQIQKVETVDGKAVYQAAVEQADADSILESGTQIVLVCDDDTEYDFLRVPRDDKELKEQEMYRVTLHYDAESGRFVVLAAENWEK